MQLSNKRCCTQVARTRSRRLLSELEKSSRLATTATWSGAKSSRLFSGWKLPSEDNLCYRLGAYILAFFSLEQCPLCDHRTFAVSSLLTPGTSSWFLFVFPPVCVVCSELLVLDCLLFRHIAYTYRVTTVQTLGIPDIMGLRKSFCVHNERWTENCSNSWISMTDVSSHELTLHLKHCMVPTVSGCCYSNFSWQFSDIYSFSRQLVLLQYSEQVPKVIKQRLHRPWRHLMNELESCLYTENGQHFLRFPTIGRSGPHLS